MVASAQRTLRLLALCRGSGCVYCVLVPCAQLLARSRLVLVPCRLCWALRDVFSHPQEVWVVRGRSSNALRSSSNALRRLASARSPSHPRPNATEERKSARQFPMVRTASSIRHLTRELG